MTAPPEEDRADTLVLRTIRTGLLVILVTGLIGTTTELLLLEHWKGFQLVPLGLLTTSLVVLAWRGISRGPAALQTLQILMLISVGVGIVGLGLHYKGNVEFELEMYPSLSGTELFWAAITGATPALAPGTMVQLGLIGLAYTYRHPALTMGRPFEGDGHDPEDPAFRRPRRDARARDVGHRRTGGQPPGNARSEHGG